MEIINYKIKDAPEDIDVNLRIASKVKGKPFINNKKARDIFKMSFDEVEELKEMFVNFYADTSFKILKKVYNVEIKEIEELGIIEFFQAFNHVRDIINNIVKAERNLSGEPKEKLKAAGIDRLKRFGSFNILIEIAEQFRVKPSDVGKWEYGEVYTIALYNKIKSEIKENL